MSSGSLVGIAAFTDALYATTREQPARHRTSPSVGSWSTAADATTYGLNGSYTMTVATSTTLTYPNATSSAGAPGTFTDSFVGLACQTGARAQTAYNTYLSGQGGGAPGVDTLFALTGVIDPTFTDKWAVNGTANYMTADLIHPTTTGHIFAAVAARTAIASLP